MLLYGRRCLVEGASRAKQPCVASRTHLEGVSSERLLQRADVAVVTAGEVRDVVGGDLCHQKDIRSGVSKTEGSYR